MEKSWLNKFFATAQKPKVMVLPANADHADAEVQFSLGLQCASGLEAAQDFIQAADWYRKAADQNHSLAQFNLGTMYANGQGVAKDDAQSVLWFGRAANLGDAGGQYKMGGHCQRDSMDGPSANAAEARIEAYKWFQLSAAQGYKNSEAAYATLTFKMTRAEVAEGNERVARFIAVKKNQPAQR